MFEKCVYRSCGATDNASDYGSEDSRFESWQDRRLSFLFIFSFIYITFLFHFLFRFSSFQAFKNVLKETNDLAGQREVVAENLQSQVITGITLLSKNLRDERKKSLQEGAVLQTNITSQLAALERAKRNYEKAYRDAEKAVENYQKADADFNLSRAEVITSNLLLCQ